MKKYEYITEALEESSRSVLGEQNIELIDRPSMGGEDFSVYLETVPGALLRLGCGTLGETNPFLHSPVFDLDESCLVVGTRILIRTALILTQSLTETGKE